jgi:ribonucleoside-diphosphate reductase beta chain
MTIFNPKVFDTTKQYMFFGEELNVARFDKQRYEKLESLTEQQHGFFWKPAEVDISRDRYDFNHKLTEHERKIFISNLQYQTLLDSVQGRAPTQVLLPICSLPELEGWIEAWSFSESIHSRSYTHIIRNVFDDPSKVLDEVLVTPEILERSKTVTKYYDELEEKCLKYRLGMDVDIKDCKETLLKCLFSVYCLEHIRFYASFACSYSFNERRLMEGNSKIIKLINRDEFLHQGAVHFMLTRFQKGLDDPDMTEIFNSNTTWLREMVGEVYEQECDWCDFLFKDGSMVGLNAKILKSFVEYQCNTCLLSIGLEPLTSLTTNPLPWMEAYTNADKTQVAPQESEISSYLIGAINKSVDKEELKSYKL